MKLGGFRVKHGMTEGCPKGGVSKGGNENGEWRIDVSIEATECPQDGNLHNEENFGNKIEVFNSPTPSAIFRFSTAYIKTTGKA